jgi:hypothetical protein
MAKIDSPELPSPGFARCLRPVVEWCVRGARLAQLMPISSMHRRRFQRNGCHDRVGTGRKNHPVRLCGARPSRRGQPSQGPSGKKVRHVLLLRQGLIPFLCDAQSIRARDAGRSWASVDRYFVVPNFKAVERLAHRLASFQNGVVIGGTLDNSKADYFSGRTQIPKSIGRHASLPPIPQSGIFKRNYCRVERKFCPISDKDAHAFDGFAAPTRS